MHSLLSKWLEKRGLKDTSELDNTPMPDGSPTERQIFESYKAMLSNEPVTLETFKEFIASQIGVIEGKWQDLNLDQSKKAQLIPYHLSLIHI